MKDFDSRVYSVNDFYEWYSNGQLNYNPFFQRRSVWSPSARSYLMDTIVRGKPIPKVFLRQILDAKTKKSVREVIDGQQRLRTIIGFLNDEFSISKKHNDEYGGKRYSALVEGGSDIEKIVMNYEISADLLVSMSNAEVLDIFSRLNSYAVTLNEQEKFNAEFFGEFKLLSNSIGHKYNLFWQKKKILSDNNILRMGDAALTAELIVSMLNGIQDKKSLRSFYVKYEDAANFDSSGIEEKFDKTMAKIQTIFGEDSLSKSVFNKSFMFYTLFGSIYHILYGMPNEEITRDINWQSNDGIIRSGLEKAESIISSQYQEISNKVDIQFVNDSSKATTVKDVRERRQTYILNCVKEAFGEYDL